MQFVKIKRRGQLLNHMSIQQWLRSSELTIHLISISWCTLIITKRPNLSVFKEAEEISGNGTYSIEYAATEKMDFGFLWRDTHELGAGQKFDACWRHWAYAVIWNGEASVTISSVTPQVAGSNEPWRKCWIYRCQHIWTQL